MRTTDSFFQENSKEDTNRQLEAPIVRNNLSLHDQEVDSRQLSNQEEEEHNKSMVKAKIHDLTIYTLLDACGIGPQGYMVNYIHADVVQKIKDH